jgi:16S rRNA (cytidine1402-2'-O)-methyltransferase
MSDWTQLASGQTYPPGTLYVVATPIGNVADLSLRALHVLGLADAIACEDTRNTGQLLTRVGLQRPLVAVHEHNEREAAVRIVERLRAGSALPMCPMPARRVFPTRALGWWKPCARPARRGAAAGPSAAVTALSVAGDMLEAGEGRFTFVGFLPGKAKARADEIARLAALDHAWVLYEAPHRIADTLAALAAAARHAPPADRARTDQAVRGDARPDRGGSPGLACERSCARQGRVRAGRGRCASGGSGR